MSFLVYVSSSESREIHAFRMDPSTGALDLLVVTAVPGAEGFSRGNMPMLVSSDRRMLYVHVRTEPYPLFTYSIEPGTGRLTLLGSVTLPAPMTYLSLSNDGRCLFSASYDGALIAVNRIDNARRVEAPSVQTLKTPPKAHCILQVPKSPFVYVTSVDGETVLAYRFDADACRLEALSQACARSRDGDGPRHLAIHPTLNRIYCLNEHSGALATYSADPTAGTLTVLQIESLVPSGFSGNAMGADIHPSPDGAFVYASVRETNTISAFRIDPALGTLARAGTFTVEKFPRGFAIEPTGRYLLCAGQLSGTLGVYAIDQASGALEAVRQYAVGKRPSWIEIISAP